MKAKTLVELLSLSTTLYTISKDEDFFHRLEEMAEKGKKKVGDLLEDLSDEGEDGENKLLAKIIQKAKQAKEELEAKMEETAVKVYRKMNIAHAHDLKGVLQKIEVMERKLNLFEAQLADYSRKKI